MTKINKQIFIIFILLIIMYYYDNLHESFSSNSNNSGSSDLYGYTSSNRDYNYTISGLYPPKHNFYQNSNDILYSKGFQSGKTRQNRILKNKN
jgi:hypothetical protein